jgi:hypothetical protein
MLRRRLVTAKRIDLEQLLDAIPTANAAVRVERQGESVVLFVPIRRRFWMGPPFSWLLPFRQEKGFALDALGAEVFSACDGERTLERIIEDFAEHHRLRFHEARLAVTQFLRTLSERNLVALVVQERP